MQRYYKLRPSSRFTFLLFLLNAAALTSVWLSPVPFMPALVLTVLVSGWCVRHVLLDGLLRMGHSCVAFRLDEEGQIVLVLRNGEHQPGRLFADSLVTPYLVILNVVLSDQRGTRRLLVLPDAMGVDSFRQLRVALRWGGKGSQAAV